MSEDNGVKDKDEVYKKLSGISAETKETLVVVEKGKPQSVVVPFEDYKNLKTEGKAKKSNRVKGVILAGGHGTRLRPLTHVTNKHLLPVYDRPMIYYPLAAMQKAGVKDVLITTNPEHAGDFINLLGNGEEFDLNLQFTTQKKPGGIAEAISLAEAFAEGSPVVVVLGDNLFDFNLRPAIERFKSQDRGARIFAKHHPHPEHYGVVEVGQQDKVLSIEEKPQNPKSNYIAIGIYMYYPSVFDHIKGLSPSDRGELEVTDLNNIYRGNEELFCETLSEEDWWVDAGTSHLELFRANMAAAERMMHEQKKKLEPDQIPDEVPTLKSTS